MSNPIEKRLSVDSVEGDNAVLVDGRKQIEVPASWLPEGSGEGSWVKVRISADAGAEDDAGARVRGLQSTFKRR